MESKHGDPAPCGANGEVKGGWDADTVAELTAEYRRQTNVRGYTISRWQTFRPCESSAGLLGVCAGCSSTFAIEDRRLCTTARGSAQSLAGWLNSAFNDSG
jgi:hypothetical protein